MSAYPSQGAAAVLDTTGLAELGDQPDHLRPRAPGDLAQVAPEQVLVGLAEEGIAGAAQGLGNELIGDLALRGLEAQWLTTPEEGADLLQALESLGL
jgi:hypothetical protein